MKLLFFLTAILFFPAFLSAQVKFNFGIHLNPTQSFLIKKEILDENNSKYKYDILNFRTFTIGFRAGLNLDFNINENIGIKLEPSILLQEFSYSQSRFPLDSIPYTINNPDWVRVRYWGADFPLLFYKQKNLEGDKGSIKLLAGVSIDFKGFDGESTSNKDRGDDALFFDSETFKLLYSGIIGIRYNNPFKDGLGAIECGISYHHSLKSFPGYKHDLFSDQTRYIAHIKPDLSFISYDLILFFGKNKYFKPENNLNY